MFLNELQYYYLLCCQEPWDCQPWWLTSALKHTQGWSGWFRSGRPTDGCLRASVTELGCIIHEQVPLKENLISPSLKTNDSLLLPPPASFCLSIRAGHVQSQHNYSLILLFRAPFTFDPTPFTSPLLSLDILPSYPSPRLLQLLIDSSINIKMLHLWNASGRLCNHNGLMLFLLHWTGHFTWTDFL